MKNISRTSRSIFGRRDEIASAFGLAMTGLFLFVSPVSAQGLGGVDFQTFHADITIHPDATFTVDETITGEFYEERHGIFRDIPVSYEGDFFTMQTIGIDINAVERDGGPVPYESYVSGGFQEVKIGDPDVTFMGPFTYRVRYDVSRAILYNASTDELYWNVSGSEWDDPFESVTATVHVADTPATSFAAACYTGATGSTAQNCTHEVSDGVATFTSPEFLTLSLQFPKGIVREPTPNEKTTAWLLDNWGILTLILPFLTFVVLFLLWFVRGRDRRPDTIMAEYEPPNQLTPCEVGMLVDGHVHDRDFSAAIIHLASSGYLQIEETQEKALLFTSSRFSLKRVKPSDEKLSEHDRALLDGLFGTDESFSLTDRAVGVRLRRARKAYVTAIYASMASRGYFVQNPNKIRNIYVGIGIGLFMLGGLSIAVSQASANGFLLMVASVPSAFLFFFFGQFMGKRTEKGDEAYAKALGFKEYLATAETHRIRWQEKEHVFESFLPYAMVFGVADKWSRALADYAPEAPSWYVGRNITTWSAVGFTKSMTSFSGTFATATSPKSSSSSSGSSGGGFGGGGGGSW